MYDIYHPGNNMKGNTSVIALTLLITSLLGSSALGADYDVVKVKLESAMGADIRTTADTVRDRNRRPIETLEFFGLRDDMKVVELLPGGGWYTKLLAPVLAENGELYIAYGTSRTQSGLEGKPGFEKMQVTAGGAKIGRAAGARFYTASNTDLGVKNVDMVLTFRNYHNFDVDPVQAIREIQAAGFEFVDYSDLHYRADDELIYEVGRKTVTGNTDRWTLKFRKP